jgi:hypothetical protein
MNQEEKEDKCEYTSEVYLGQSFLAYEVLGSVAKLSVPDHEMPSCQASGAELARTARKIEEMSAAGAATALAADMASLQRAKMHASFRACKIGKRV